MIVYYDETDSLIAFGVSHLLGVLRRHGFRILERRLRRLPARPSLSIGGPAEAKAESMVVAVDPPTECGPRVRPITAAEGFAIQKRGPAVCALGADSRGAMYGALDLAEQIQLRGLEGIVEKAETPFLAMRGVKFNLPWEPYDTGDAYVKNDQVCWELSFWRSYIDNLAFNRYNCLTLWSRHPFHLMFRLEKYPETTALSDAELESNMRFFRALFRHARDRGVDTYIITWCVDIIPQVVKGLGLPPHFADPQTDHSVRQGSEVIKDYFRECVKTLLRTYPDLTGIGTSASEEMAGDEWVREQWVADTYLQGVKESGRAAPFIHRTNMQTGRPVKELFADHYPGQVYISWKYSNAHMYSHPEPIFEQLWGAWEGVNLDEIKVTYTVRNDDIHTFRWGDPNYVRDYVVHMKKPYVHGFYWGADGYLWGIDFQHSELVHKRWTYDFERQWYQFALWGRMSYNPDLPAEVCRGWFRTRFGSAGDNLFSGIEAGSRVVPAVSRLFWIDYDFQWHPESCLSLFGYKTIRDFVDGAAMPGSGVVSISEYVRALREGISPQGITPSDIVRELEQASQEAKSAVEEARSTLRPEEVEGELECVLLDIEAWSHLGSYYRHKFAAAIALAHFQVTGDEEKKAEAVGALGDARDAWMRLGEVWSRHYQPYFMTASKRTFGYPLHLQEIEQDIEIAKGFKSEERAERV